MAETIQLDEPSRRQVGEPVRAAGKPASGKSKKALMIATVVVVQLIGAYFLVGFLLRHGGPDSQEAAASVQPAPQRGTDPSFDHVYVVKDLIVNPAGTNGLRFLLTTIGLEVTSEETVKELEKRDVQIHDSIIGILTSKTLPELDNTSTRDSLKVSIKDQINKELVTGTVVNVYFSKFIIQ
jgi:flagellar basal body-associated protein FliL